jgi:hypothetical protein
MRISSYWLRSHIAGGLVVLLAAPLAEAAPLLEALRVKQPQNISDVQSQAEASDVRSPDTGRSAETFSDNPAPVGSQAADQTAQTGSQQAPDGAPRPVGTAAAPYEKTTGVAASRPAGAVIAPAKQRRARSILIRVSVVVGAAVAVGTVVALSHGSPGRPN